MNMPQTQAADVYRTLTPPRRCLLDPRGHSIADDAVRVGDDEPIPTRGVLLVPYRRLLAEGTEHGDATVGVLIGPADLPIDADELLAGAGFVAIDFPKFGDGRGHSHAIKLRRDQGYRGEIRAVGDVGVDQLHYLARVGFDRFSLRPGTDLDDARAALLRFTHFYVGVTTVQARLAF